jgi:hypothetical protein
MTSSRKEHSLGPFVPGMDNRRPETRMEGGKDDSGDRLRSAVNVDVSVAGTVKRRSGYAQALAGSDCHSFWADGADAFMVDGTDLLRVIGLPGETPTKTVIRTGLMPGRPVSFTQTPRGVFYSDGARLGRITAAGERTACLPAPNQPTPLASSGSNLARFGLCFAYVDEDGEEGPATYPVWVDAPAISAISVAGFAATFPPGAVAMRAYITNANDRMLQRSATYTTASASVTVFTGAPPGARCPTLHLQAMPPGRIVRHHGARLLVADGRTLYYSEPFMLGLINPMRGFIQYSADITVVEPTSGGLWVCADQTYWYPGLDLGAAQQVEALPYGGVAGTGGKTPGGDAFWLSPRGTIVASDAGTLNNVQEANVAIASPGYGASLFRETDGLKQFVQSTFAPGPDRMAAASYMEAEVIRRSVIL